MTETGSSRAVMFGAAFAIQDHTRTITLIPTNIKLGRHENGGKRAFQHAKAQFLPIKRGDSVWFAVSSPAIGLVLGVFGAWFVSWLTS